MKEGLDNKGAEINKYLADIREVVAPEPVVEVARVYGSSLYKVKSVDIDIAILTPSENGVITPDTYKKLRDIRSSLCNKLAIDVDLIPHTRDEVKEKSSPLANPRYYPSLKFGVDVKNTFPISEKIDPYQNASVYVLLDNRTVARRQILRQSGAENWRIFISKLVHGPGNALTYLSLKRGANYLVNPSNIAESFFVFDKELGVNSSSVIKKIEQARQLIPAGNFTFENAVDLLNWYESLVSTVLDYDTTSLKKYLEKSHG